MGSKEEANTMQTDMGGYLFVSSYPLFYGGSKEKTSGSFLSAILERLDVPNLFHRHHYLHVSQKNFSILFSECCRISAKSILKNHSNWEAYLKQHTEILEQFDSGMFTFSIIILTNNIN